MRKSIKKLTAMSMAVMTAAASLAGCSSGGSQTSTATTAAEVGKTTEETTAAGAATAAAGAYADYSGGFEKQVTIQIPVYDRAFEGWNVTDNYYTRWIQSEFGDKNNIKVEFVGIGRSTEVNDYMQMLASGKSPDIIFHYDMPQALTYYDEGAMQKLDLEEIANYAPTYWGNLQSTIENYGKVDDGHYFFFGARPEAYNWITLIRQDWIDAVGKTMPTNLTELNELYAAWRDAGLGNGGGNLVHNNFTYSYPFRSWPIDEKERALYSELSVADMTTQATHDYLKNLNYQYNNDLIDKEFYLNTDDASTQADFVSGNSGIYALYIASQTTVLDSVLKNSPEAKFSVLPYEASVPEGGTPQERGYWPFGMIMGINHSTSDEERAAVWMYLEWMSQPDNLFYLQNGIEGQNYTLDESGLAVKVADYAGESKLSNNNNKDYWCLVVEGAEYDDEEVNKKANIANWAPVGYEYLIEDAYDAYYRRAEYRTPDVLFTTVISSIAEYKSDLNEKWKELYVKCAMAPEDKFEETYAAACEEFLAAGYQAVLDEKQAAIDAGSYN